MGRFVEAMMTILGKIHDGKIEPLEPLDLPEGATVELEVRTPPHGFWQSPALEELASAQEVGPITNLEQLRGDWPEEDSVDEFLEGVRKARR